MVGIGGSGYKPYAGRTGKACVAMKALNTTKTRATAIVSASIALATQVYTRFGVSFHYSSALCYFDNV